MRELCEIRVSGSFSELEFGLPRLILITTFLVIESCEMLIKWDLHGTPVVHVHVELPSRQDSRPPVPWRHTVEGADK